MSIPAIYRNGRFEPTETVDLPEGSSVLLQLAEVSPTIESREEAFRWIDEFVDRTGGLRPDAHRHDAYEA